MSEVKKESIGAWKNMTKEGKEVIKFSIKGQRYNMWINQYKEKNSQPDFKIYEDNWIDPNAKETLPQSTPIKESEDDLPF